KSIRMTSQDVKEELIMFGLRTRIGIPRSRFKLHSNGQELEQCLNMEQVNSFVRDGFLIWDDGKYYGDGSIPLLYGGDGTTIEHKSDNKPTLYENDEIWLLSDFVDELKEGGLRPTEKGLALIDEI
ncbi:9473_t:CDS:2, partial [Acaulospora colombiana]